MATADIELVFKDVQLSFADLFTPKANKNKKTGEVESYTIESAILFDKGNPAHVEYIKEGQAAMKQAIANKWPSNPPIILPENRCFRPGEVVDPDTNEKVARYEGYANKVVLTARKRLKDGDVNPVTGKLIVPNPVQLLGPKKTEKDPVTGKARFPILTGSEGLLYSGAFVTVIVRIYAYDGTKHGNPHRVNCSLEVVKFKRHGQAFGAKPVDANSLLDDDQDDDGDDDMVSPGAAAAAKADDDDDLGL